MNKLFLISLILFVSCNKEEQVVTPKKQVEYDFSKNSNSVSAQSSDDFSDLKKLDDESCETEEEIKEKLVKPKQEAFQLQGGDSGCDINELNKKP